MNTRKMHALATLALLCKSTLAACVNVDVGAKVDLHDAWTLDAIVAVFSCDMDAITEAANRHGGCIVSQWSMYAASVGCIPALEWLDGTGVPFDRDSYAMALAGSHAKTAMWLTDHQKPVDAVGVLRLCVAHGEVTDLLVVLLQARPKWAVEVFLPLLSKNLHDAVDNYGRGQYNPRELASISAEFRIFSELLYDAVDNYSRIQNDPREPVGISTASSIFSELLESVRRITNDLLLEGGRSAADYTDIGGT